MQRVTSESLTRSLARIVRDGCRSQHKEIDFAVHGETLRVDRRAIGAVRDGLVHLVRNAVDHGVESPADRRRAGKRARGRVELDVAESEDMVVFAIRDDGRGIDLARVREQAIRRGLLTHELARDSSFGSHALRHRSSTVSRCVPAAPPTCCG